MASYVGVAMSIAGAIAGFVLLVLAVLGSVTTSTSLWILVSVLFLGGVQLISIGVLGRYLARVHEQVLARPLYLVSEVVRGGHREQPDEIRIQRLRPGTPVP
jgi:hypothetical protein